MTSKIVNGKRVEHTQADLDRIVAKEPTPEELLQTQREQMIVTPWQFRKAINQLGKRGTVTAVLSQADQDTKDGWEVATQFERLNPLIISFGSALWPVDTDVELDNLFILAATL